MPPSVPPPFPSISSIPQNQSIKRSLSSAGSTSKAPTSPRRPASLKGADEKPKKKKSNSGRRKLPPGTMKRSLAPTPGSFDRPPIEVETAVLLSSEEPTPTSAVAPTPLPDQPLEAESPAPLSSVATTLTSTDETPALMSALQGALNLPDSLVAEDAPEPPVYADDFEALSTEDDDEDRGDRDIDHVDDDGGGDDDDDDDGSAPDSDVEEERLRQAMEPAATVHSTISTGSEVDTDDDCRASISLARQALNSRSKGETKEEEEKKEEKKKKGWEERK